jgi:phosphoribosyl-dephospho-CoA transferase
MAQRVTTTQQAITGGGIAQCDLRTFRVAAHDLLMISGPDCIESIEQSPEWVKSMLASCPFVVVRRQVFEGNQLAVGVRGSSRSERWACVVHDSRVQRIFSPMDLRSSTVLPERMDKYSAFHQLAMTERTWSNITFPWGPAGSVGFEIATGFPAVTASSDLDIIVYADTPFDRAFARELLGSTTAPDWSGSGGLLARIDILVETPYCAFSLAEYAQQAGYAAQATQPSSATSSDKILLRFPRGPVLGLDPWEPCK